MTDHFLRTAIGRANLSSVKVPLLISLCNQFVSSGGNFLIGVYLARTLSLEGFGLYGIGYGLCMLYVGIGNAIILTQMVVNMPDKAAVEKDKYAAKMFLLVAMLGGVTIVLAATIFAVLVLIRPEYIRFMPSVIAVSLAAVLFLCNEFFISYAYLKRKESRALLVNALTILVLFSGLAVERMIGIPLAAVDVLLLYALGAAVGSFVAYIKSPLELHYSGVHGLLPDMVESWRNGRWAFGGSVVTWMQTQAYTYVLAFFLGPGGVGQANAARIFISPFSFLIPAINKLAIPRLADLRNNQPQRMFWLSIMLTLGLSLLTVIYSLALLSSLDFVAQFVLGRNDPRIESIVWTWCLVLVFQMIRSGGAILLQVQRKFRVLMLINIPSALVTVVAAILLIYWLGTAGAVLGMVTGEIVLSALIWREIRNAKINEN